MSISALDLLIAIDFLNKDYSIADFTKKTDKDIKRALDYYFKVRRNNFDKEYQSINSATKLSGCLSSQSAANAVIPIMPYFLVYEHVLADDPLFPMSIPESPNSRVQKQAMGFSTPEDDKVDRHKIINKLTYFSALAPVIKAGFLSVLPLTYLHQPPQNMPVYLSEDCFRSEIPANIHDFIHEKAIVKQLSINDDGQMYLPTKEPKELGRNIHITFKDDEAAHQYSFYNYVDSTCIDSDAENSTVTMLMDFKKNQPLDKNIFDVWRYQSINKTIIARLSTITHEMYIANSLGHKYITDSEFESQLLGLQFDTKKSSSNSAVNFLKANDTLLSIDKPELIIRLRESSGDTFDKFQSSLMEIADNLNGIDEGEFQQKSQQLFYKEIQPHIDTYQKSLRSMKFSATKGALTSLGGVGLALCTGTAIPLAIAGLYTASNSLTEFLPSLSEFKTEQKNAGYVWNNLKK